MTPEKKPPEETAPEETTGDEMTDEEVRAALRSLPRPAPPADFTARVMDRVRSEERARRRRPWFIAAAATLVLGLSLPLLFDRPGGDSSPARLAEAPGPATASSPPSPPTGEFPPAVGEIVPAAGDISPAAGEIVPAAGDISPAAGDISPAAGDISPAAGDISPATGDISPAAGDAARAELEALRQEVRRLVAEMERARRFAGEPVIHIGGSDDLDLFLDLESLWPPVPGPRGASLLRASDRRPRR